MGDYSSDFEYDSEVDKKRKRRNDLTEKTAPKPLPQPSGSDFKKPRSFSQPSSYTEAVDREAGSIQRFHLLGLDAYARHKMLINEYLLTAPGSTNILKRDTSRDKTDLDVIRENQKFLWDEDEEMSDYTWEQRLARKYYDKLFKEYCIVDLRAYKQNKFGMRWRTEKEVTDGKGQFICGSKHCTNQGSNLKSWEVNFAYAEDGVKKNALVKLRLCPDCSRLLNYTTRHKEAKRQKSLPAQIKQEPPSTPEHARDQPETLATAVAMTEEEVREQEKAVWEKPALPADDKSRHHEFDEYFADMLL